jgi:hypothetical protein
MGNLQCCRTLMGMSATTVRLVFFDIPHLLLRRVNGKSRSRLCGRIRDVGLQGLLIAAN